MALQVTQLDFSESDLLLVGNSDFFRRKKMITDQIIAAFHSLPGVILPSGKSAMEFLPAGVFSLPAKISRGENYKGLPWIVLDYPRLFEKNNVFAFRTLFWWGNYISITLHLSGSRLESLRKNILSNTRLICGSYLFISNGMDEWNHDVMSGAYSSCKEWKEKDDTFKRLVADPEFLKLARIIPLEDWKSFHEQAAQTYDLYFRILSR